MTTHPAASPGRRRVLSGLAGGTALAVSQAVAGTGAASAAPTAASSTLAAATTVTDPVLHLLRRATFGPTPALVAEVRTTGTTAWLDAQLSPSTVPDAAMDAMVTRWPRLSWKTWEVRERLSVADRGLVMSDLLEAHVARALFSRRQLLETVVDFWTNHLVVPVPSNDVYDSAHLFQRDVIRKHALGKYSEMLYAAARHPALLNVLDNADSAKKAPNENYGRELLELHTVGIGNYTEADVKMSALALTGLSVDYESGLYSYKPQRRFVGPVKVMGWSHSNTSAEAGEVVASSYLNYLALHPATANRIATKLAVRFVSDTPPATLVAKLAQAYITNGSAIAPVLRVLFLSQEFAASVGQKVRTPYEDALASCRIFGLTPEPVPASGSTSELRKLVWQLGSFGQAPMGWPAPNGYPDNAAAWNGASSTLNRWNFHLNLAGNWTLQAMKRPDLATFVPSPLPPTYGALADALAAKVLISLTPTQRDAVCRFADHAEGDALKAGAAAVTARLPLIVALLLDSPNFSTR